MGEMAFTRTIESITEGERAKQADCASTGRFVSLTLNYFHIFFYNVII